MHNFLVCCSEAWACYLYYKRSKFGIERYLEGYKAAKEIVKSIIYILSLITSISEVMNLERSKAKLILKTLLA